MAEPKADTKPPERIEISRRIGLVAYRFRSRTRKDLWHDTALMHAPPETGRGPSWECTCEANTLGDEVCWHIRQARKLWDVDQARKLWDVGRKARGL